MERGGDIIKIRDGGFYLDGNGDRLGPMTATGRDDYPWSGKSQKMGTRFLFTAAGVFDAGSPSKYDLVAEVIVWESECIRLKHVLALCRSAMLGRVPSSDRIWSMTEDALQFGIPAKTMKGGMA